MKFVFSFLVLVLAYQASAETGLPPSVQPVRMARIHGFIEKTDFSTFKREKVCDVDSTIPVYDERLGKSTTAIPKFATCSSTRAGLPATITIIGDMILRAAGKYGPASKDLGITFFVGVKGTTAFDTVNTVGAGSEDLSVSTLKIFVVGGSKMYNPSEPSENNEMFTANLTVEDK